jgi:hypothetical protein
MIANYGSANPEADPAQAANIRSEAEKAGFSIDSFFPSSPKKP